jgi:hypothetical protein
MEIDKKKIRPQVIKFFCKDLNQRLLCKTVHFNLRKTFS